MKRIKKRLVAVMLAVNMLVMGIFGSYQTAQAAEIVAGYTIAQVLETILLSFGISIFTTGMIKDATSASWWDTDGSAALQPYYDDLEQAYEQERFKVINGGGNPQPSPTPAPDTSPIPFPTSVPASGDIPTFQELVAPALVGGAAVIDMTQGAWECMGKAVSSLWNKIIGRADNVNSSIDAGTLNLILSSGYPYYIFFNFENKHYVFLGGVGSFRVKDDTYIAKGKCYVNGKLQSEYPNGFGTRVCLKNILSCSF